MSDLLTRARAACTALGIDPPNGMTTMRALTLFGELIDAHSTLLAVLEPEGRESLAHYIRRQCDYNLLPDVSAHYLREYATALETALKEIKKS